MFLYNNNRLLVFFYLAIDDSVDHGLVLQRISASLREDGHEAQFDAVLLDEGVEVLLAEVHRIAIKESFVISKQKGTTQTLLLLTSCRFR